MERSFCRWVSKPSASNPWTGGRYTMLELLSKISFANITNSLFIITTWFNTNTYIIYVATLTMTILHYIATLASPTWLLEISYVVGLQGRGTSPIYMTTWFIWCFHVSTFYTPLYKISNFKFLSYLYSFLKFVSYQKNI